MNAELLGSLAALALFDSTSIGTLLIPVLLLLLATDRPATWRVAVYLAAVAGFYFCLGGALMLGLLPVLDSLATRLDGSAGHWVELAVGVGLFALSFRFDPKRRRARGLRDRSAWAQDRIARARGSAAGMVALGVTAAGLEAVTMLPYLAAVGLLLAADLTAGQWLPLLAGYNALMMLPAAGLLAARVGVRGRAEAFLTRLGKWLSKHADDALGWALAIVGFVLARDGLAGLLLT